MKSILGILGILAGTMLIAMVQNTAYAETDQSNFQNEIQKELASQSNHAQNAIAQLNLAFQFQINNQLGLNLATCVVSTC
jgi:xanthosine utilization system XapX-like protein